MERKSNYHSLWIKRCVAISLSLLLLVPVLAACSKSSGNPDEKRVLNIATMYGSQQNFDYLRTQYTDIFEFTHPNIEIQFQVAVDYSTMRYQRYNEDSEEQEQPDPVEEMKKLMTGPNPPDVVMLDYGSLPSIINENMLVPLDSKIEEDEFDVSDYVPSVINSLRDAGNNKLYALAPMFSSSALIYNQDIFDQAGVEYPKDNMTWDQIFNLAERVSKPEGENPLYGFAFNNYGYSNLFSGMQMYTAPLGMRMFNDNADQMTVNTKQWEDVWNQMLALNEKKIVPQRPDPNQNRNTRPGPFDYNTFLSGKTAMTIINYNQLPEIINANVNAQNIDGFDGIRWNVVTFPIHQEKPGIGGGMYMDPILGINAKAQNPDDAWEFIKFINGKEWAKLKSRGNSLVSRKEFIQPINGLDYNIEAFYQLKPAPSVYDSSLYRKMPNLSRVRSIGRQKFQQVMNGDITVKEGLEQWETEGNAMLKQIKENPDGPISSSKEALMRAAGEL